MHDILLAGNDYFQEHFIKTVLNKKNLIKMKYTDLRSKTPLDFTSDKKILEEIGLSDPFLIENVHILDARDRAILFYYYAEEIKDNELFDAINEQFADIFAVMGFEELVDNDND